MKPDVATSSSGSGLAWGLTGGIACGKSEGARYLERHGIPVIDTDAIAREVVEPGREGYKKVIDAFGSSILNSDGSIHRGRLGQWVFSDQEKRDLLNSLLHPLIRSLWKSRRASLQEAHPALPVVVMIPLLFETGVEEEFDLIICIGCSEKNQRLRLAGRGLLEEQMDLRLQSQLAVPEKMEQADFTIWNNGSLGLLKAQVDRLVRLKSGIER